MSSKIQIEDSHAIACHEAGHLIAARFRGRGIEKVSLDHIDGKRGCFLKRVSPSNWTEFDEILTCLAGPRAQVALRPDSVDAAKIAAFETRIIQTTDQPRQIPSIYDNTGWQHDVQAVHRLMVSPRAPVFGLGKIVTRKTVLAEVERRLLELFAEEEVVSAARRIAELLSSERLIDGPDAEALVETTGILDSVKLRALMTWQ